MSLLLLLCVVPRGSCVRDISEVERRVLACQHRSCEGVVTRSDVESLRLRDESEARRWLRAIRTNTRVKDVSRPEVPFARGAIPSPHSLLVGLDVSDD